MEHMPLYHIHRMKEQPRAQFRFAPHAAGVTPVKPRDYEPGGDVEAAGWYAAWNALKDTPQALEVGDLLEMEDGDLRVFKYVGFEEARWTLPELRQMEMATAGPEQSAPVC
jgi:hypothetical protein